MSLKDKYAVVGVGLTKFGKIPGISTMSFTLRGIKLAIEDAGLTRDDVDGLLVISPVMMGEQHGWAARVAALLEISTTFTATMEPGFGVTRKMPCPEWSKIARYSPSWCRRRSERMETTTPMATKK